MSKRKAKAKWKADTKRWQVDVRKGGIRRSFYSTISAADAEKKAAKWDGTPPVKKEKKQPETVNCTPFVRQYGILSNKWGVLLCQKEYQTNDIRRNSKNW